MELTESVKYDLVKAEKEHQKSGKFTVSCLYRVRQLLVDLEKLGLQFRKLSIAYEKELEKKNETNEAKGAFDLFFKKYRLREKGKK